MTVEEILTRIDARVERSGRRWEEEQKRGQERDRRWEQLPQRLISSP